MTFILVLVFYMYDVCNCCAAAVREHRGGGEYHHQGTHLPGQRPTATRQAQHPADLLQIDDLLATGTTAVLRLLQYEDLQILSSLCEEDLQVLSGGCWW